MSNKTKVLFGWAINDSNKNISLTKDGKLIWKCPYYSKWVEIIKRCKSVSWRKSRPTYNEVTVCEDWKYLSNFIEWVDNQPNKDWKNCEPDKDILFKGNKHYSPETVVFVSNAVNKFITESSASRGELLIGVCFSKNKSKYVAQCRNFFTKKGEYLGVYDTELEAHLAWKKRKHELACELAKLETDPRIIHALTTRYAGDDIYEA